MGFWTVVAIVFVAVVILAIVGTVLENKKVAAMSPSERQTYLETKETKRKAALAERQAAVITQQHGQINPVLVCPHCQEKGKVRSQPVKRKKGISGGKATAAILTGGVSILATGLSRREKSTEVYCGHCGSKWDL